MENPIAKWAIVAGVVVLVFIVIDALSGGAIQTFIQGLVTGIWNALFGAGGQAPPAAPQLF